MAPLYLSNLACTFSTRVQDAFCNVQLGSMRVQTDTLRTNTSRLNWPEDLCLEFDPRNPAHAELKVEVCSSRSGPIATCSLPVNPGSNGRQEINRPLKAQVRQYNNGTLSCLLHTDDGAAREVRDSTHSHTVGAVPGYTTGHLEQAGQMNQSTGRPVNDGSAYMGAGGGGKTWGPVQQGYGNSFAANSKLQAPGTVQAPLATPKPGGLAVPPTAAEAVCNRESYTAIEPRPLVKETTRVIREHRPWEKEFVTEVRYVGERELPDRLSMEHLKTEERLVEETHTSPCSPFKCEDGTCNNAASISAGSVGPRKANFAAPRPSSAYTGLGASRTARPQGADLGNWSTTYSNSYEDPNLSSFPTPAMRSKYAAPAVGGRTLGAYKAQAAPYQAGMGATYAPGATAGANFTIKAGGQGAPGQFYNPHGPQDLVCNREFFTMTEDRPIVKEVKDYVREHHFYEKQFVKETRFTGKEQQTGVGASEQLDCNERIVEATPAAPPCQGCTECAC